MLPRSSKGRPTVSPISTTSQIRRAATEFVRGTSFGWGRRELASWLVCHYSPCLVADAAVHPDGTQWFAATLSPASVRLDDERIERLILDARCSVLRLLADLAWPSEAAAHAESAIGAGHVIATRDCVSGGDRHWAPVGRRRMRLAERVGSLFIADALNHPLDYPGVSLCRACGELGFGAKAVHQAWCEHVRRVA
jgi:hypothetical protein